MSISEKIMAIQDEVAVTVDNHATIVREGMQKIADVFAETLVSREVSHKTLGLGTITTIDGGWDVDTMSVTIQFPNETKKFGLRAMTNSSMCPVKITDEEIVEAVNTAAKAFTKWHWEEVDARAEAYKQKVEAEKKADEERKADLKYQRHKESSIKAFDKQVSINRTPSTVNEFYYSLGWLVSHCNSVSAALPDYLESAFKNHFGADTPCRVVDSQHRGPAGWQSQWSWSFKIGLKKHTDMPSILVPYISPSGKEITSTEFIWDLIDLYGFQFGKSQDEAKIEACIPSQYFNDYLDGKRA